MTSQSQEGSKLSRISEASCCRCRLNFIGICDACLRRDALIAKRKGSQIGVVKKVLINSPVRSSTFEVRRVSSLFDLMAMVLEILAYVT